MTTFDERNKGFENKFALDEELAFKVQARMKKLVALWAAAKMGKNASEAENYAAELVQAEMSGNTIILIEKLQKDFTAAKVDMPPEEITAEITRQTAIARTQIVGKEN